MIKKLLVIAVILSAPPVLGSTEPPRPSKMEQPADKCFVGDAAKWLWDTITAPIDWLLGDGGGDDAPQKPFGGDDPYGDGVKNKNKNKKGRR